MKKLKWLKLNLSLSSCSLLCLWSFTFKAHKLLQTRLCTVLSWIPKSMSLTCSHFDLEAPFHVHYFTVFTKGCLRRSFFLKFFWFFVFLQWRRIHDLVIKQYWCGSMRREKKWRGISLKFPIQYSHFAHFFFAPMQLFFTHVRHSQYSRDEF